MTQTDDKTIETANFHETWFSYQIFIISCSNPFYLINLHDSAAFKTIKNKFKRNRCVRVKYFCHALITKRALFLENSTAAKNTKCQAIWKISRHCLWATNLHHFTKKKWLLTGSVCECVCIHYSSSVCVQLLLLHLLLYFQCKTHLHASDTHIHTKQPLLQQSTQSRWVKRGGLFYTLFSGAITFSFWVYFCE